MGVGLQIEYIFLTSSGIVTHLSVVTSCLIKASGNRGASASGPKGCMVPGFKGGNGLLGISAMILYQFSGISLSSKFIFLFLN